MVDVSANPVITSEILVKLVGWGSGLATFVASVMGDEQNERLKNGTFGAVAGTSIGGLAGLMKGQSELLVVGFLGSVIGAFAGWLTYLLLSLLASLRIGRRLLEYHGGGLKGVREQLKLDEEQMLLSALGAWRQNFSRMILEEKQRLRAVPTVANDYVRLAIETWLTSVTDLFALVFATMAKKPQYQSRVTVIVYGLRDHTVVGKHWISYSGRLPAHKKAQEFDRSSVGYKVLSGEWESPYFTTGDEAKQRGQDRGQQSYRPFITFRLTSQGLRP